MADCSEIPRERLAGLKAADIRTVEELAELPDRSLQRLGADGRALQKAAQAYLQEHDATAKLADDLKETQDELAALKAQLAEKESNGDDTNSGTKRSGGNRSHRTK